MATLEDAIGFLSLGSHEGDAVAELVNVMRSLIEADGSYFEKGRSIAATELASVVGVERRRAAEALRRLSDLGYLDLGGKGKRAVVVAKRVPPLPDSEEQEPCFSFSINAQAIFGPIVTRVDRPEEQRPKKFRVGGTVLDVPLEELGEVGQLAYDELGFGKREVRNKNWSQVVRLRFTQAPSAQAGDLPRLLMVELILIPEESSIQGDRISKMVVDSRKLLETGISIFNIYRQKRLSLVWSKFKVSANLLPIPVAKYLDSFHGTGPLFPGPGSEPREDFFKPWLVISQATFAKQLGPLQYSIGYLNPEVAAVEAKLTRIDDSLGLCLGRLSRRSG